MATGSSPSTTGSPGDRSSSDTADPTAALPPPEDDSSFPQEPADDNASLSGVSSVASAGVSDTRAFLRSDQYVNCTSDTLCRVLMKKVLGPGKKTFLCVCAMDRSTCSRRNHLEKQGEAKQRAPGRYYPSAVGASAPVNKTGDGIYDLDLALTSDEFLSLQLSENVELREGLQSGAVDLPPDVGTSMLENFATHETAAPVTAPPAVDLTGPTPRHGNPSVARTISWGREQVLSTPPPVRAAAPGPTGPPPPTLWYGMGTATAEPKRREVVDSFPRVLALQSQGWLHLETFDTLEAALSWQRALDHPVAWYGFELPRSADPPQQTRYVTSDQAECNALLRRRARFVQTFPSRELATAWVAAGLSPPVPIPQYVPAPVPGTVPGPVSTPPAYPDYHSVPLPGTVGAFPVRAVPPPAPSPPRELYRPPPGDYDPSSGNKHAIFGMPTTDQRALFAALLPVGFPESSQHGFFSNAPDIPALPGTYQLSAPADEVGGVDVAGLVQLAAGFVHPSTHGPAGYGRNSTNIAFQGKRRHHLATIKDLQGIGSTISDIERIWDQVWDQFERSMRSDMHVHRYSVADIDDYVHNGGLPSLVLKTKSHYLALLSRLRDDEYSFRDMGGEWDRGLAKRMLDKHSTTLFTIRRSSSTFIDMLLRVYIHLRDARQDKFMGHGIYRDVMLSLASSSGVARSTPTSSSSAPSPDTRCNHCGRRNLHDGGKPHCPTRNLLTAAQTRSLVNELDAAKGKRALAAYVAQAGLTPDADKSEMIQTVRASLD